MRKLIESVPEQFQKEFLIYLVENNITRFDNQFEFFDVFNRWKNENYTSWHVSVSRDSNEFCAGSLEMKSNEFPGIIIRNDHISWTRQADWKSSFEKMFPNQPKIWKEFQDQCIEKNIWSEKI